jgi:hypothetical protein
MFVAVDGQALAATETRTPVGEALSATSWNDDGNGVVQSSPPSGLQPGGGSAGADAAQPATSAAKHKQR